MFFLHILISFLSFSRCFGLTDRLIITDGHDEPSCPNAFAFVESVLECYFCFKFMLLNSLLPVSICSFPRQYWLCCAVRPCPLETLLGSQLPTEESARPGRGRGPAIWREPPWTLQLPPLSRWAPEPTYKIMTDKQLLLWGLTFWSCLLHSNR